jgi:hypothetical protein
MPVRTGRTAARILSWISPGRACFRIRDQTDIAPGLVGCGLASHATVIDKGQIVYTATIDDLKANDNIRQRYLAL